MKLSPFEIHRPGTLADASRLLVDLGDEAVAINGGTELLLTMKLGLAHYAHLVDLKRVAELRRLAHDGARLSIGAGMTHRELETSAEVARVLPAMAGMLRNVANVRVRSVGTLGGNLCFADPHSDPATYLAAMGAVLVCGDGRSSRTVPAEHFVLGPYETVLESGELLVGVEIPLPAAGQVVGAAHVRMKTHERPTVTVAAKIGLANGTVSFARVAVGSVCGVPAVPDSLEALLGAVPAQWGERVADCAAATAAAIEPFADADGSVPYKRALVEVFVRRGLAEALAAASSAAS